MTQGQPGHGERREIMRAMPASVERLHREAQRLIDELVTVRPLLDNDLARRYLFSDDAIARAGFEPGAEVWLTDAPYEDDDPDDEPIPAQVTLFYSYEDDEIVRHRDTSIQLLSDGRIVADQPSEVVRAKLKQQMETEEGLARRLLGHISPLPGSEIFSQAECDQWLKLIALEFELHGRQ